MEHTFEQKAFIANNRPFMQLIEVKAEPIIIESEYLTEYNFYAENLKGKVDPDISRYNGISFTLKFANLGNDEMPISVGFNKFAQFIGMTDWDINIIFDTPAYISPIKCKEDGIYEQDYLFVFQPCDINDERDFEKFEEKLKDKDIMILLNIICSNDKVEERFESIGTIAFDGTMHDAKLFTKDRRSYFIKNN